MFGSPQTSPRATAPVRPEIMGSLSMPQVSATLGDPHSTDMATLDLVKSDGSSSQATLHSRRSQNIFPHLSMKPRKSFIGIKAKSKEVPCLDRDIHSRRKRWAKLSKNLAKIKESFHRRHGTGRFHLIFCFGSNGKHESRTFVSGCLAASRKG